MRTVRCSGRRGGCLPARGGVCPSPCWVTCLGGCLPQSMLDRILDTCLWKHYLSATTVADGNNFIWFLFMLLQVCLRNICRLRSTVSASTLKPSVDFTSKFYVNNRKQRELLENAIPDRWAMAILYSNGLSVAFIEFALSHSSVHSLKN